MIRLARIVALVLGTALLCHYLPGLYDQATRQSIRTPTFNYSAVLGRLLVGREIAGETVYMDLAGQRFSPEDYELLTPFNHFAQLARDGRAPESVHGLRLNLHLLAQERTYLRLRPQSFESGLVNLRPLLEAESGKVNLEMPSDFLRLGEAASFLQPKGNTEDLAKSRQYTDALREAGVRFPVVRYGSFPTTHKPYDEGFILEDAQGVLFQLRQVRGQPEVFRLRDRGLPEQAGLWDALRPRLIEIQEQPNQRIRAVIITTEDRVWVVFGENYRLAPLLLTTYRPEDSRLLLRGDPLHYTVLVRSPEAVEVRVYDRNFAEVAAHTETVPGRSDFAYRLGRVLFPLRLDFREANTVLLGLFWDFGSPWALGLSGSLALGFLIFLRRTRRGGALAALESLAIVAGGLVGLIVVLALPPLSR